MPDMLPEVAVIGAGLAGLTAALHLAERGVPVLLLEADSRFAGGRLWGGGEPVQVTLHGHTQTFYPEHGMHGFWNNYLHLCVTLERFGVAPEIFLAQEEEWIHLEQERVWRAEIGSAIREAVLPAPLHYLEFFTRPSFLAGLGLRDWLALPAVWYSLLLALVLDPFERAVTLEGASVKDFFTGWTPRLQALFAGLTRSGLGTAPTEASLAAFIAFLRFYTLLRRDAWRFSYLTADPGQALIDPLVAALRARGGELQLGALVEGLAPQGARWRVQWQAPQGRRTFYADHVIMALDAPAAQRLLLDSPTTRSQAEKMMWPVGLVNAVVRVWLARAPRPGPEAGIFTGEAVVDNFFWLHQIQRDFAAWAKTTGGSAVEMHIYGPEAFLAQPPAVILARALQDLYRAYPELRGQQVAHTLQINGATHTRLQMAAPDRWLGVATPWPGLWACGDWVRGPWPALFLERAAVSALAAANGVLETAGLPIFPLHVYPPPEPLVVGLQKLLLAGRAWLRQWRGKAL